MLNNIHYTGESVGSVTFMDFFKTFEMKTAACDESGTDLFFFRHGIEGSENLDAYFDAVERLGLIYTSRNKEKIIIRNNKFF